MKIQVPFELLERLKKALNDNEIEFVTEQSDYVLTDARQNKNEIVGLNGNDEICSLMIENIIYFYSDGNNVYAYNGEEFLKIKHKLYEVENLKEQGFIRVNKSQVINVNHVKKSKVLPFSKLGLIINDDLMIEVNRSYTTKYKTFLRGNNYEL